MKIACIFLASGYSTRYGRNKLVLQLPTGKEGQTECLVECVWNHLPKELFSQVIVVTKYDEIAKIAERRGYTVIRNIANRDDIAETIRLGLAAISQETEGCLFSVCDQPYLSTDSIRAVVKEFTAGGGKRIEALGWQGQRGNPVLFPKMLFEELHSLQPNESGKAVIQKHQELLHIVEASTKKELDDIDKEADMMQLLEEMNRWNLGLQKNKSF
ncbi:MAG: nucleotidyltransferase family protein [Lachnospiraceae bacterium]